MVPAQFAWRVLTLIPSVVGWAEAASAGTTNIHTTWLWHLHHPFYWPPRRSYGGDYYEAAWDSVQQQKAGRPHPSPEILPQIFGLADRVAAFPSRPHDAVQSILGYPNAGVRGPIPRRRWRMCRAWAAPGKRVTRGIGIPSINKLAPGAPAADRRGWI